MGIFGKFFGGGRDRGGYSPTEEQDFRVTPDVVQPPKPRRLETEIVLEVNSEIEKPPHIINTKQLLYGKPHITKGGPIINGAEHGVLNHTQNLDTNLAKGMSGIIFDPEFGGDRVPSRFYDSWSVESGPILKMSKIIDGKPYIICVRKDFRSEDGEGTNGRKYTSARVIAIPAEEWSVSIIPQLSEKLRTEPLTKEEIEKENNTKDFSTEILDKEFPEGWFSNEIEEYLVRLVSGNPASVQDVETGSKEFLNRIFYCMLCLPEKLARQVSFGTCMPQMTDRIRLSHGMIGRTSKSVNIPSKKWHLEDGMDFTFGNHYVAKIKEIIQSCKTPRDVMRAVASLPNEIVQKVEQNMFGNS